MGRLDLFAAALQRSLAACPCSFGMRRQVGLGGELRD